VTELADIYKRSIKRLLMEARREKNLMFKGRTIAVEPGYSCYDCDDLLLLEELEFIIKGLKEEIEKRIEVKHGEG